MQTVPSQFIELANGHMRPLKYGFMVAFDKQFNPDVDFFTIEVSEIGGDDFIPGTGDVIQEWDKYVYTDYSDRVIDLEWTRTEDSVWSVAQAMGDITVNNYDDFFTPNSGSPLQDYILPGRPVRILAGFGTDVVQTFVGLTEGMPEIDRKSMTARFHVIDFLTFILNQPLEESVMYIDKRTDEILDDLLTTFGFLTGQYNLDVGLNTVRFTYYERGDKFGDIVNKLMEAEMGRFFMDEQGVIRFQSRQYPVGSSVHTLSESNTVDYITRQEDDIVNVVEVKSVIRVVQSSQIVWETTANPIMIEPNGTVELWADFQDPVTTLTSPEPLDNPGTSFYYVSDSEQPEGNISASVDLVSINLFSTSAKMIFENTNAFPVYMLKVQLYGTPAKAVQNLYIRETDDASIEKYGEKIYTIENNLIQTESDANSIALTLLHLFSEYDGVKRVDVKGNPAWQLSDVITVDIDEPREYQISRSENVMSAGRYRQVLDLRGYKQFDFFTIEVSAIEGGDQIAP